MEVIYSTFDELPEHHKRVSEMVIERAKRLVEHKRDVVILLDSITRLARAYNLTVPPSGRTLVRRSGSGGAAYAQAVLRRRQKYAGGRQPDDSGHSPGGDRQQDGRCGVTRSSREPATWSWCWTGSFPRRRVFPAIDISKSGTRREDLLLDRRGAGGRGYHPQGDQTACRPDEAVENILNLFARTKNNRGIHPDGEKDQTGIKKRRICEAKRGMDKKEQMSESFRLGVLLAITGGFLDAYSYVARGKVFATAETGNMVLMGLNIAQGNWQKVPHYLIPIICYALGVLVAEQIKGRYKNNADINIHWRQVVVLAEILVVAVAAFIPQGELDIVANSSIAFVCSMQVESFRKVNGNAYATTMCTGNLTKWDGTYSQNAVPEQPGIKESGAGILWHHCFVYLRRHGRRVDGRPVAGARSPCLLRFSGARYLPLCLSGKRKPRKRNREKQKNINKITILKTQDLQCRPCVF